MKTNNSVPLTNNVRLREVTERDIPFFFQHQLDKEANYMAAFTVPNPTDRGAFQKRWERILNDETIIKRTIEVDGEVAGHLACFRREGQPEITYWLGKTYWGKGIATHALKQFLSILEMRPIYARVVADNIASCRVLEKCRFKIIGREKGFANARGAEVEEFIMIFDEKA